MYRVLGLFLQRKVSRCYQGTTNITAFKQVLYGLIKLTGTLDCGVRKSSKNFIPLTLNLFQTNFY